MGQPIDRRGPGAKKTPKNQENGLVKRASNALPHSRAAAAHRRRTPHRPRAGDGRRRTHLALLRFSHEQCGAVEFFVKCCEASMYVLVSCFVMSAS